MEGLPEKLQKEKGSSQGSPRRSEDEDCHSNPEPGRAAPPSRTGSSEGLSLSFFPPKSDTQRQDYPVSPSDPPALPEGTAPCEENSQGKESLGVSSAELLQALCRLVLGEGTCTQQQQETATEVNHLTTPAATTAAGSGRGSVSSVLSVASANVSGPMLPSKYSPDLWNDRCGETPEESPFCNSNRSDGLLQADHKQERHSLRIEDHVDQFGGAPTPPALQQQRPHLSMSLLKDATISSSIERGPLYDAVDGPSPLLQQLHPRQRHFRAQRAFTGQQNDPWALATPLEASCSRLPNRQPHQQQHFALHDRGSFARRWPRATPPPPAMRGLNRGAPQRPPPRGDVRGAPVVLGRAGGSRPSQASNLRALLACYVQLALQQQNQNRMGQHQNRHRGGRGSRGSRGATWGGQANPALQQRRRPYAGPAHVSPQQQSQQQRLPFAAAAEQTHSRASPFDSLLAAFCSEENSAAGPQRHSGDFHASPCLSRSLNSSDSSHVAALARLVQPDGSINVESIAAVLAAQRDGAGLLSIPNRSSRLDAGSQGSGPSPGDSRRIPHQYVQWRAAKGGLEEAALARLQGASPSLPFPPI